MSCCAVIDCSIDIQAAYLDSRSAWQQNASQMNSSTLMFEKRQVRYLMIFVDISGGCDKQGVMMDLKLII